MFNNGPTTLSDKSGAQKPLKNGTTPKNKITLFIRILNIMKNKLNFLIFSLCLMGIFLLLTSVYTFGQENNETVTDIDGNVYNTVIIGSQTWFKENLKVTKYKSGAIIQNATDITVWENHNAGGGYCWYNNDIGNKSTYGALYNWYAVKTGNLCPSGWHVPSDEEWEILINFLGGKSVAGVKLKEAGTSHWEQPAKEADNSSGFTALPGGTRNRGGTFNAIGNNAHWWSSTENNAEMAWARGMFSNTNGVSRNFGLFKSFGFSVRCVKD